MNEAFDQFSMHDLYRMEVRTQVQELVAGLLALESDPLRADQLEACMRAAHSLKGAARLVDVGAGVIVAHSMEELFVAAQEERIVLDRGRIDLLLKGTDLLSAIADATGVPDGRDDEIDAVTQRYAHALRDALASQASDPAAPDGYGPPLPAVPAEREPLQPVVDTPKGVNGTERAMRVSADNLNRLLDLAGESLVGSRRLPPLTRSFQRLKRLQHEAARSIDLLRERLETAGLPPEVEAALAGAERAMLASRQFLGDRLAELETVDQQTAALAHRLYDQALTVRMQPFADRVAAFPRMVRDIGHSLGKKVSLQVVGTATQVDRDIRERLEAPLGHLLRNAVDHGLEMPDARLAAGKAPEGLIRLDAHHSAGMLQIIVSDDGGGIDLEHLRARVIERGHADQKVAGQLSEAELLEFLFLPGFTMKEEVSEISGRGVGLDVVRDMVRQVGGVVTVTSRLGEGTRFQLQLPLTLSVIRALLVDISGEPYAFAFGQILRAIKVAGTEISVTEGHQFFDLDGRKIGLVSARQLLGYDPAPAADDMLSVVVVSNQQSVYGIVVDSLLGARELVVQPLDPRLGKVREISAGALMEDGTPLLIIDVEDMIRSMEKLADGGRLNVIERASAAAAGRGRKKRVLVVDDSFTVRELQRKLLTHHGYEVELAVDGMEGWNSVRGGAFDLVVTDVDMPRMDGIELVERIKRDPRIRAVPVMILSYKDREDDRQRGLDAGADYYLTKGSYQSDALIEAVLDLIGEAEA
ncbi:MAG: hybrid sensor histidine kinase/response regulator [Sphingobium sp.]